MTIEEYQEAAMRTRACGDDWGAVGFGLAGEAGEVIDLLKKHLYQGHKLDKDALMEELGDIAWYIALACDIGGFSLSNVLEKNIEKLRKRYPDGFTAEASVGRKEERQFKPKIGENYYYAYGGINGFDVYSSTFSNRPYDIMCVATGNCFKTKLDAEKYKEELFEKIRTVYKKAGFLEYMK